MTHTDFQIPIERKRQFDVIEAASEVMRKWARANDKSLAYIYPVVPFVDTDFSLDAWLFVDTENRIREYQADGTLDALIKRFCAELASVGYPAEWSQLVSCHFGSKEVVDRDFEGSYFSCLR